ncbi:growth arrest and DNA damage-inducible protein GADD45 alpha-like [Lingula anatina]|uniref:Growth arrest and DNA damage-inducible protein GADD45 alpha-like n=1 Tax=Lingula anatina TaxID=7574 RepID=A0A1S3J6P8_LINAN|nr:growth arrest and DNA damage-inducible protein GADD45 alpha-like [Lingula anatina]|eukprot:XP_013406087.1 growth arrest and DNA damage-inducible protein GADD45 alpha-like [Lingula anatina]
MGYPESLRSVSYIQMENNNEETVDATVKSVVPPRHSSDICRSLCASVVKAREEGRLTCGVYQAARVLETNTDHVMLCILAADTLDDLELSIHFTLLEAYCWENDIRVIKVDSATKLWRLLFDDNLPANANNYVAGCSDDLRALDCVLIEFPKENKSDADARVLDFCKANENVDQPRPIIELPV